LVSLAERIATARVDGADRLAHAAGVLALRRGDWPAVRAWMTDRDVTT
jgi:hypothetical protein